MATYSAVTAGQKDADSPINVSLIDKLDQNPHAMFEGASGAPKLQTAAIADDAVTNAKLEFGYYSGTVHSDGTTGNSTLPSGWTVATTAFSHEYVITHSLGTTNYTVVAMPSGTTTNRASVLTDKQSNTFKIVTTNLSNGAQAEQFDFIVMMRV
jgi:hypothetical protein